MPKSPPSDIGRLDQRGIIDVAHSRDVPLIPHNYQVDLAVAQRQAVASGITANRSDRDRVVVERSGKCGHRLVQVELSEFVRLQSLGGEKVVCPITTPSVTRSTAVGFNLSLATSFMVFVL
jgi:hypothetical protein